MADYFDSDRRTLSMTSVQRRVLLIGAVVIAAVPGALVFEAVLSIGEASRGIGSEHRQGKGQSPR